MDNIHDLLVRIPAPMHVAIDCDNKLPTIISFKLTLYNLQMAYYWLKDANEQLLNEQEEAVLLEVEPGGKQKHIVVPSIIGIPQQVQYIDTELRALAAATQDSIRTECYPDSVKYKLEQGYNKVMEAVYSNEISRVNYDEYTKEKNTGGSWRHRDGGIR